jgi:hypothetical protein
MAVALSLQDLVRGIYERWATTLVADEAADDSDKSLTVPASTEYKILWIWVELTTTGDVGNRQMAVQIQDSSKDVVAEWRAGAVQAASLTRYYSFAPGAGDLTSFRDTDYLMTPIPPDLVLPAGYIVRVYDKTAVKPAADDMVVQMMVQSRAV